MCSERRKTIEVHHRSVFGEKNDPHWYPSSRCSERWTVILDEVYYWCPSLRRSERQMTILDKVCHVCSGKGKITPNEWGQSSVFSAEQPAETILVSHCLSEHPDGLQLPWVNSQIKNILVDCYSMLVHRAEDKFASPCWSWNECASSVCSEKWTDVIKVCLEMNVPLVGVHRQCVLREGQPSLRPIVSVFGDERLTHWRPSSVCSERRAVILLRSITSVFWGKKILLLRSIICVIR